MISQKDNLLPENWLINRDTTNFIDSILTKLRKILLIEKNNNPNIPLLN